MDQQEVGGETGWAFPSLPPPFFHATSVAVAVSLPTYSSSWMVPLPRLFTGFQSQYFLLSPLLGRAGNGSLLLLDWGRTWASSLVVSKPL